MSETSSRLLELLSLLQGRRDWPGDELAERLEVSGRTIRRDIERLRRLGYPVESLTGPFLPPRPGKGSADWPEAVQVTYSTPTGQVPPAVCEACTQLVGHWYRRVIEYNALVFPPEPAS